jgi:nucleotide-binding universal stress UspA family protein
VKSVNRLIESGNPARQILAVAAAQKIDLIVMGTRGHSDLEGLVMGSVAHKVSHGADCTVVTVK